MAKIVFFGNCQMQGLGSHFAAHIAIHTKDAVSFVAAYSTIGERDAAILREADIVVEQIFDQKQISSGNEYFGGARIVKVPLVTGLFLYPFSGGRRLANLPRPAVSNGAFTSEFGCSYLDKLINQGGNEEDIVDHYCSLDMAKLIDLDRLLELALDRQSLRDEKADFETAQFIEDTFRTQQLFLTVNHVTPLLSRYIAKKLYSQLASSDLVNVAIGHVTAPLFSPARRPFHPSVVRHFDLLYGQPDETYEQQTGERLTFRQFVGNYVRNSVNEELVGNLEASYKKELTKGETREVISGLKRGLSVSQSGSFRGEVRLAHLLIKLNELDEGAAALARAVNINPADAGAALQLAKVQSQLQCHSQAEETLRAAMLHAPSNGDLYYSLYRALSAQFRFEEAAAALLVVIGLKPHDPFLWSQGIDFLVKCGRLSEAHNLAQQAIVEHPTNWMPRAAMGRVFYRLKRPAESIAASRVALRLVPNVSASVVLEQLSHFLFADRQYADVIATAQDALQRSVDTVRLRYNAALAFRALGSLCDAIEFAKRAFELDPTLPGLQDFLLQLTSKMADAVPE